MGTIKLYLDDPYLKEFESRVLEKKGNIILLEKTAFYPEGGGQPYDTGIIYGNEEYSVIRVFKEGDMVYHELDRNFSDEENVRGRINWDRRYSHMRHHTAIHVLSGILFKDYGARITGSQIYEDRARMDINYDLGREMLPEIEAKANEIVKKGLEVTWYYIDRKDFRDDMVRIREDLLPEGDKLRIVEIKGFDMQADGGTHVKNTSEIGNIKITKYENKGKMNKRIYINLL
ncbi:MAG: alanyl-tRNA editing protein [Thermoplasmata archaeon]|jgi:misacylated tRNA(Ala) deacylase|nr:alanyl-tRNA editing protein [Thermoplasmatales archaeon]PMP73872.1 MAG: alanyl-tRNA editing protein [Aciduliprofundum sp.]HEU13237.1 alanyl-tRNA editing protein [Euryarchaeota archaeon]